MKSLKLEVLSHADILDIDETSKNILEKTGIYVNHPEALELFKKNGCEVDEAKKIVKIPRGLIDECMSSSPNRYKYYGRDEGKSVTLSGDGSKTLYAPLGIATNITDYDPVTKGFNTRAAKLQDIYNMSKIVDCCPNISHMIQGVSALDIMAQEGINPYIREWDAMLRGTSKPFMWDSNWKYNEDAFKMEAAVYSDDEEEARKKPFFMNVSCTTSPLQLDYALCDLAITSANYGIPMMIMTMGMAGTSAPFHLAATIAENNAENLAGLCISQLTVKGAPNLYGSCTDAFDFYCNSSPFGSPEATLISCGMAQMANFYQIPGIVAGCVSDSKLPDQQSAHERTLNALMTTLVGAANLTGCGMINMGMSHSFEQMVIDNDIVGMIRKTWEGIDVTKETLLEEVVEQVGPMGDYIAAESTLFNLDQRSNPEIFDRHMVDEWRGMGSKGTMDIAHEKVKDIIANHEPMPIDSDVRKRLDALIKEADKKLVRIEKK